MRRDREEGREAMKRSCCCCCSLHWFFFAEKRSDGVRERKETARYKLQTRSEFLHDTGFAERNPRPGHVGATSLDDPDVAYNVVLLSD